MKGCELCDRAATMYCESDQASLCWECDARVHGANFLVARHSRRLLCRRCQSPTPWRAAGAWLGPTISVCERCAGRSGDGEEKLMESGEGEEDADLEEDGDYDDDEGDGNDEVEEDEEEGRREGKEEEEDGDNQVVPWALPPPVASSSSSEDSSIQMSNGLLKRDREKNADLVSSQDNRACSSAQPSYLPTPPPPSPSPDNEDTSVAGSFSTFKDPRRSGDRFPYSTGDPASGNRRGPWGVDSVSRSPPI